MIKKWMWWMLVAVVGVGGALILATDYRYVPVVEDVVDPLGRPSALADSVIFSSSEFDRIAAVLVPKHAELTQRIGVLYTVADSLDEVVGRAGNLTPLAVDANHGTGEVVGVALPLPGLVGQITSRSKTAIGATGDLHRTLVTLNGGLADVGEGLGRIDKSLSALGPKASDIAKVLAQIEEESERIAPLGPVLGLVAEARKNEGG